MTDKEIKRLIYRAEHRPGSEYAKHIKKVCELLLASRSLWHDPVSICPERSIPILIYGTLEGEYYKDTHEGYFNGVEFVSIRVEETGFQGGKSLTIKPVVWLTMPVPEIQKRGM